MGDDVLTARALGRATLARQHLLERATRPALDTVHHLVGLQAQVPHNPYVGLWSRLAGFGPDELSELLTSRQVVRIVVMRGTVHLVTAGDCLVLRPLSQPVLDREIARHRDYGPVVAEANVDEVLAFARPLLAEPRTGPQLRAALAERFPGLDGAALAYACRNFLPLVQVPPRGVWGRSTQVTVADAEAWLGRPLAAAPSIDEVVLRYLAAFGPATVADVAAWSGLTGLGEVVDRLRPRLRPFRDERGRRLVDLPDAPRPDADTPAPPRFLPEYDNVVLSHADRTRFLSEKNRRGEWPAVGAIRGSLLVDGLLTGLWSTRDPGAGAVLDVHIARPLAKRAVAAVVTEGRRLVRFLGDGVEALDVRVTALP